MIAAVVLLAVAFGGCGSSSSDDAGSKPLEKRFKDCGESLYRGALDIGSMGMFGGVSSQATPEEVQDYIDTSGAKARARFDDATAMCRSITECPTAADPMIEWTNSLIDAQVALAFALAGRGSVSDEEPGLPPESITCGDITVNFDEFEPLTING